MDIKKRSANVTEEQKTLLLQFMEKNPRLISGKFSADFTYKDATILWQKLTDILNSCNGVNKDWKSWRKCWQDLRSRSKMKQSKINTEQNKTGGGSESNIKLSSVEEATLNLMYPTSINGHMGIKESQVQIQPETEINFETDEVEYLEENIDLIPIGEHSAAYINTKSTETKDNNDKENTLVDNAASNSSENSNDSLPTSSLITKKRKKKSQSEKVQLTQESTQILAEIAKKTYEIQKYYYKNKLILKKQELELKEKLINAIEKCNLFHNIKNFCIGNIFV